MPIPTFVAAGTQAQTATNGGTGPITPGLPAGLAADDILVLYIETANQTPDATTGYSNVGIGTVAQATGLVTALTVRWKRATSSESAPSVSVTGGDHIVARLVAFRGCVTSGTPFESVQTNVDNTTGTGFTVPGGTTLGADRMICAAVATGTDVTSTAMASGWTNSSLASPSIIESLDNWHLTGNGGGFAAAYGGKATAGAYNATTGTLTTGNTKALMSFALIGASAPAAPPALRPRRRGERAAIMRRRRPASQLVPTSTAAPGMTVTAFQTANWTTATTPLTISVTGALSGDKIVVIYGGNNGITGGSPVSDATVSTTGGSTGAWTEPQEGLAALNQAWLSSAAADVTANGTVTVSLSRTQTTGRLWGGMALLFHNHGGLGNSARSAPSAAETVNLTVSQGSAVAVLAIDWDALAAVAFSPAGATDVHRAQDGPGPDLANYAGYWLNQTAGTRGYGIGTSSTTNLHIIAVEVLAASGGSASSLAFGPVTRRRGLVRRQLRRTDLRMTTSTPPPTNPDLVSTGPARRRPVARAARGRVVTPPPVTERLVQNQPTQRVNVARRRSRTGDRVPDQVTPPTTPTLVPMVRTHRPRWWPRRSESAQPVQVQVAPPVTPDLVPFGRARRKLFGRRVSQAAEVLADVSQPPSVLSSRRRPPRLKQGAAADAPMADQPTVSAPLERRRFVVRRSSGRSASPTPTQQAAPQNPVIVALPHERPRRVFRRNVGRAASPVPAQQAAPTNPAIVFVTHVLRARALLRGNARAASPTPAQQTPANPPFVPSLRGHVRSALRRGDGRTASPAPTQIAAPQNPPFVPVAPKRIRRAFARAGQTAMPLAEQQTPIPVASRRVRRAMSRAGSAAEVLSEQPMTIQVPSSPLRAVLRRIRRVVARFVPFIDTGDIAEFPIDVHTGTDRYSARTGQSGY